MKWKFPKTKINSKILASKTYVCKNKKCLSNLVRTDGTCHACKSEMFKFDSKGEADRYVYLVKDRKINVQFLQKKFRIYNPALELEFTGRFTDDFKVVGLGDFKESSKDLYYTCDFIYDHPTYPQYICIEDYKPCGKNSTTGKIDIQYQGDSYLRIREIARQYRKQYIMLVSYKYNNQFYEKVIEPK